MGHRIANGIAVAWFLLLGAVSCGVAQQHILQPNYDGRWWLSVSLPERSGFVVGFLDCYSYEYKGPGRFITKSYDRYRDLLSQFYQKDSSRVGRRLVEVFDEFRDGPGEKIEAPGGEPVTSRHSGNDGLYWKQLSVEGHDRQLGFVEGYLACHKDLAHDKGGAFTKPASVYRVLITRWYRYDEKTDAIDPKREPEAIADVLFKVR